MRIHYGCSKKVIFQTQLNGIMAVLYCQTASFLKRNCALEQHPGLLLLLLEEKLAENVS